MANRAPSSADRAVDRWDIVFEALGSEPRRRLVDALFEAAPDEPVTLPEAAAGPNAPLDRDELRVRLYHHHLPLLADSKYVRWESEPFRAFRGPRFAEVAFVFESVRENADRIPGKLTGGCLAPGGG